MHILASRIKYPVLIGSLTATLMVPVIFSLAHRAPETVSAHLTRIVATPSPSPSPSPSSIATPAPRHSLVRAVSAPQPIVRPTVPSGSVEARVLAAWPGDDAWADHVVRHESGFDPQQYGGMKNGDCCWGLWQFSLGTYHSNGGVGNPINDSVEEQTRVAWRAFLASGSQPWAATAPWYVPPRHG